MKYRLIRFSQGKVVLDKECMTPNQYGCNKEWHEQGNDAVLIELPHKSTKGEEVELRYYYLNDGKISSAALVTWVSCNKNQAHARYPYLAMLELNGAL